MRSSERCLHRTTRLAVAGAALLGAFLGAAPVSADVYSELYATDDIRSFLKPAQGSAPLTRKLSVNGVPCRGASWTARGGIEDIRSNVRDWLTRQYQQRTQQQRPFWIAPSVIAGPSWLSIVQRDTSHHDKLERVTATGDSPSSRRVTMVFASGQSDSAFVWDVTGSFVDQAAGRDAANADADVPGGDPAFFPRPVGSRRLLTIEEQLSGRKLQTALYATAGTPRGLMAGLRTELEGRGFKTEMQQDEADFSSGTLTSPQAVVSLHITDTTTLVHVDTGARR